MADQGFPQSHTTTTTTSVTMISGRPFLDTSYLRTLPGLVKVVQAVLDFICFICVVAGPYPGYGGAGWGTFVSIVAFIVTIILLIMYLFHMIEMFHFVPWLLVEMLYCALWTFFYLIASSVLAAASTRLTYMAGSSAWGAFAFFGFCAMIAYGFDCFLKFRAWRNGEIAQGMPPATAEDPR